MGFGQVELGPIVIDYFNHVEEELGKDGIPVHITLAPPFASSEVRAPIIAAQIDQILARTGKRKVNIIAHSQGGLDARLIASPRGLGYGDRIASITMVSTPNLGSRIADTALAVIDAFPGKPLDKTTESALELFDLKVTDFHHGNPIRDWLESLSEKYQVEVFNPKYVDDPRVVYKSYAGRTNFQEGGDACNGALRNDEDDVDPAQLVLWPTALFLADGKDIVNDGVVTLASAKWGTFERCIPADHLKEIGHIQPFSGFDHVAFYRRAIKRVRALGL
jgi:triacylglycerol lipase